MATYTDLKTRVITETSRDDLSDDLATLLDEHIAEACAYYSDMRFWFNQAVVSVSTVATEQDLVIPVSMRIVDRVAGPYGDLTPAILSEFTDAGATPRSGTPTSYTWLDGNLRFDPVPDDTYDLTVYGLSQIDPPSLGADSNVWTNEAQGLIVAHTKLTLFTDIFRDQGGAALAATAVSRQRDKLRRETDRRLRTRLSAQLTRPNGQPVRTYQTDRW